MNRCHLSLCPGIMIGIVLAISQTILQPIAAEDSVKSVGLAALSLDQLGAKLDLAPRDRYATEANGATSYEAILCEITRRGDGAAVRLLTVRLDAQEAQLNALHETAEQLEDESDEAR